MTVQHLMNGHPNRFSTFPIDERKEETKNRLQFVIIDLIIYDRYAW